MTKKLKLLFLSTLFIPEDYCPLFNLTSGKFASSFEFDGADDKITIYENNSCLDFSETGYYSWATWVKPRNTNKDGGLFTKAQKDYTGFTVYLYPSGNKWDVWVIFEPSKKSLQIGNAILEENKWHHVAITYSYRNASLYVDGVLRDNELLNDSDVNSNTNSDFILGYAYFASTETYLNGSLDDFVIYTKTLTASDVLNLYRLKTDKYYWKVNATNEITSNESKIYEFSVT